eukprot:566867-Rhodomonas_salina.1
MKNPRLSPFWIKSQNKEIKGIWDKGCFKRWKHSELCNDDRVVGSLFQYHIKCYGATGHVTNCKVVMGNRMKEGEDYEDTFAPRYVGARHHLPSSGRRLGAPFL